MGSGEGLANCPRPGPHIVRHADQRHLVSILVGLEMGDDIFDEVVIRVEAFPTDSEQWCAKVD
ncbi:MAG: hypothetical protein CMF66_01575 [Magnetovibrio sp.]|nr:hypothetical protein [Magnetovibrio sp.]